jgi:hypothetical protein
MKIEEIKKSIKAWNNVRNSPDKALTYFKQGSCFKITKAQFDQWNKNSPENLRVYMAIFGDNLKFVLIDSESDKDVANHLDALFVQDYLEGLDIAEEGFIDNAIDGSLTIADALKKMTHWTMFVDSWVANTAHTTHGIFQAIIVPFSDLKSHFEGTSNLESAVFFGLENGQADLLLWGLNTRAEQPDGAIKFAMTATPVVDLAKPVPPYSLDTMGLI